MNIPVKEHAVTAPLNPRKGARMAEVTAYVKAHPRCTKMAAAAHVGPHGSLRLGYAAVNRTIRAGFIGAVEYSNHYALYHIHD